jgi:SAM-dependent methyltransferase
MIQLKKLIKLIIPPIFLKVNKQKTFKNDKSFKSLEYKNKGQIPWSEGYLDHKVSTITNAISDIDFLNNLNVKNIHDNYGYRLDERVIEYPWIFSKLDSTEGKLLDAGSTFNFNFIVNHPVLKNKDLTILTFAPEKNCFHEKRISYVYEDLRNLPFKDELFDVVVSQSTIEHIDMDNSIYGYDIEHNENENRKSFEYIKAVREMVRVLKPRGQLLLTFPFGKFENHGFFQQFDDEMLVKAVDSLESLGTIEIDFFKYEKEGWRFAKKDELKDVVSYNPHSGKGKQDDGAAHCRSIACIHFTKH